MVNGSDGGDWLASRRRHRRLAFGVLVAGVLGFVLADALAYPILGVGVYWLGFAGFFAVRRWAPTALFDERDCALERRASYDTLRIAAVALVVLAPAAATLEDVGYFELPAPVEGAIWGYAVLFLVFGVAYLGRRYRP
jgi:uncharacterized membrane protein